MQFGICTSVENAPLAKAAGWDFVEEHVQQFLQADKPDDQWTGPRRLNAHGGTGTIPAANSLIPAALKVVGPAADLATLRSYMATVMRRAQAVDIQILVFGSGGARMVPEGFDRSQARRQILDFLKMSADLAARHHVTLVAEHLNKKECNILNSVAEAMEYVREVNHAHFQCLVDSWHLWLENEPLDHVQAAMPHIRHVHLADLHDRRAPGQTGKSDYTPLFKVLKAANYAGRISVEALWEPALTAHGEAAKVLAFVRDQWARA